MWSTLRWKHASSSVLRLRMKPDVVLKRLAIAVASSDHSYMPQLVSVAAGKNRSSLQDIRDIRIPGNVTGYVALLDNANITHPCESPPVTLSAQLNVSFFWPTRMASSFYPSRHDITLVSGELIWKRGWSLGEYVLLWFCPDWLWLRTQGQLGVAELVVTPSVIPCIVTYYCYFIWDHNFQNEYHSLSLLLHKTWN